MHFFFIIIISIYLDDPCYVFIADTGTPTGHHYACLYV